MNIIRLATRKSPLALWQAKHVADRIQRRHPEIDIQIKSLSTRGDELTDRSLVNLGGKGLFIKALEELLLSTQVDMAVHSLKDVPVSLPPGLFLGAYMPRENPYDVLVTRNNASLEALPANAKVGTASLRRRAQLLAYRSDLSVKLVRGSVQTRISKVDNGDLDGVVLAAAGLVRLGINRGWIIPEDIMLPAPGQGIIAVELRQNSQIAEMVNKINSYESESSAAAERAVSRALGATCASPVAVYAKPSKTQMAVRARVLAPDGHKMIEDERTGALEEAEKTGKNLGESLVAQGARGLLSL